MMVPTPPQDVSACNALAEDFNVPLMEEAVKAAHAVAPEVLGAVAVKRPSAADVAAMAQENQTVLGPD